MVTVKPTYVPPAVRTFTPESWQARVIKDCEELNNAGKSAIVIVQLGNGPVRWWPTTIQRVEGR